MLFDAFRDQDGDTDTDSNHTPSDIVLAVKTTPWMSDIAFGMLGVFALLQVSVSILSWRRRNIFPMTGMQIIWHISAHLGIVFGMVANFFEIMITNEHKCRVYITMVLFSPLPTGAVVAQFFYIWFSAYLQYLSVNRIESRFIKKHNQLRFSGAAFAIVLMSSWLLSIQLLVAYARKTYDPDSCRVQGANLYSAAPLVSVLGIIIGAFKLRKIQEAFKLKEQYKRFATFLISMALISAIIGSLNKTYGGFLKSVLISVGFYGYTIFCGFIPLWQSFEQERLRKGFQSRRMSTATGNGGSTYSKISPGMLGRPVRNVMEIRHLLSHRFDLLAPLTVYLVKEFCVENGLFLKFLYENYQREAKPAVRIQKAKAVYSLYLSDSSISRLNVSPRTLEAISQQIGSLTETSATPELFVDVELEVLVHVIDPFNRFLVLHGTALTDDDFRVTDAATTAARRASNNSIGRVSVHSRGVRTAAEGLSMRRPSAASKATASLSPNAQHAGISSTAESTVSSDIFPTSSSPGEPLLHSPSFISPVGPPLPLQISGVSTTYAQKPPSALASQSRAAAHEPTVAVITLPLGGALAEEPPNNDIERKHFIEDALYSSATTTTTSSDAAQPLLLSSTTESASSSFALKGGPSLQSSPSKL